MQTKKPLESGQPASTGVIRSSTDCVVSKHPCQQSNVPYRINVVIEINRKQAFAEYRPPVESNLEFTLTPLFSEQLERCCTRMLTLGKITALHKGYEALWIAWEDIKTLPADNYSQYIKNIHKTSASHSIDKTLKLIQESERQYWKIKYLKKGVSDNDIAALWHCFKTSDIS